MAVAALVGLVASLPNGLGVATVLGVACLAGLLLAALVLVVRTDRGPSALADIQAPERSPIAELRVARAMGVGVGFVQDDGSLSTPSPTLTAMAGPWNGPLDWWLAVLSQVRMPTPRTCKLCGGGERAGLLRLDMDTPRGVRRVYQLNLHGHAHEFHDVDGSLLLVRDMTVTSVSEENLRRLNEEMTVARDQALAASRAKSAFLANMSHELRTPLNAVIGYSEMLLEGLEQDTLSPGSTKQDLGRIRSSGMHLLDLISDVLDLSKVEAGKLELNPERFEVRDLAREAMAIAKPMARNNRNRVELDCPADVGSMVADPIRVRQVLFNLLSNACKFTERGRIQLSVRRLAGGTEDQICFRVADTGIGMDETQRRRLYEPFYQADTSSTRVHGGSGLGLAISRLLIQEMGGHIELQSEPGKGSTFTIILPAKAQCAASTLSA